MALLTIMISCLDDRIRQLVNATKILHPEIQYLIIHQNNKGIQVPEFLIRSDITVLTSFTKGLTKSRNIGLENCQTEYVLISDDDVEYIPRGLDKVLFIIKNDKPDFAAFKIKTNISDQVYKNYSSELTRIRQPFSHWFSSIEILLNANKIRKSKIFFDERFGLGTLLKRGEEEVLIHDCLKNNLIGTYYPEFIVIHPKESTGSKKRSDKEQCFFLGALSERISMKINIEYLHRNRRNRIRNKIYFYLGASYIRFFRIDV